ncbi:MAG: hypothetical protein RLZ55_1573, partial [Actinomycetota bacterium]
VVPPEGKYAKVVGGAAGESPAASGSASASAPAQ